MEINLNDGSSLFIEPYEQRFFNDIQKLNKEEGWTNLVQNNVKTEKAWENSNIAFIVVNQCKELVGYIRGHTDTAVSLFVCEMLIDQKYRGLGVGKILLQYIHTIYPDTRVEMLATSTSRSFYERLGYRAFYGFRKTFRE